MAQGVSKAYAWTVMKLVDARLRDGGKSYDHLWKHYVDYATLNGWSNTEVLDEVKLLGLPAYLADKQLAARPVLVAIGASYSVIGRPISFGRDSAIGKQLRAITNTMERASLQPAPEREVFDHKLVFTKMMKWDFEALARSNITKLRNALIFLWAWSTIGRSVNVANIFYVGCREATLEDLPEVRHLAFEARESFIKGRAEPVGPLFVERSPDLDLWHIDKCYQDELWRRGHRMQHLSARDGCQFSRFLSIRKSEGRYFSLGSERVAKAIKAHLMSLGVPEHQALAHNVCRTAVTVGLKAGVPAERIRDGRWTSNLTMLRVYDQSKRRIDSMQIALNGVRVERELMEMEHEVRSETERMSRIDLSGEETALLTWSPAAEVRTVQRRPKSSRGRKLVLSSRWDEFVLN